MEAIEPAAQSPTKLGVDEVHSGYCPGRTRATALKYTGTAEDKMVQQVFVFEQTECSPVVLVEEESKRRDYDMTSTFHIST